MESLTLDVSAMTADQVAELLELARSFNAVEPDDEREIDDEEWRNAESTGWTLRHVELLREHLTNRGKLVQLRAFDLAVEQGGFVSRESVFRLGGYEATRRLNHWTAPFNVASDWIEDQHGLPSDTEYPVYADYDDTVTSFQRARGFRVLAEIVKLVREDQESAA